MHRRPSIACWLLAMALPGVAAGQVVLDGSLGDPGLVPGGPDINGDSATYLIDASYGEPRGDNLFHSFSEFSIQGGETATFEGPASVENVFSRVTGDPMTGIVEGSQINGVLRSTIPGAKLFFFNSAGIAFGREAKLDVQGSFHASTADEVRFVEDGALFGGVLYGVGDEVIEYDGEFFAVGEDVGQIAEAFVEGLHSGALAILLVIVLASVFPVQRTREVMVALGAIGFVGVFILLRSGIVRAVAAGCEKKYCEYKRRQAPPGVKITPKAFGRDRRLPITNAFK